MLDTTARGDESSRPLISWPLMISTLACLLALAAQRVFADADTFWHLASGQWILGHRMLPTVDVFSHTVRGSPWVAHEWGSQLLLTAAYRSGGWGGVHAVTAAAFAATIAIIARFAADRLAPLHAVTTTLLSLGMIMDHLLARPHVLAWPLMALWIATLMQAAEARRTPPWWCALIMLLWGNLHLSYTLGLAIGAGIATEAVVQTNASDERWRVAKRWGMVLGVSGLATLINPQGWHTIIYTVEVMGMSSLQMVQEWKSPDFHQLQPFLLWFAIILTLGLNGLLRLTWPRIVLLLVMCYLALKHQRYVSLLGLVSPFVLAAPFAATWKNRAVSPASPDALERRLSALTQRSRVTGVVLVVALLSVAVTARIARPATAGPATAPAAALTAALAYPVQGNVLNGYGLGGYLIFRGIPVFIDGRSDLYGDRFMAEVRDAVTLTRSGALEKVLRKYRIGWTMLSPDSPTTQLLDYLPGWTRIYSDSTAVVHMYRNPAPPLSR